MLKILDAGILTTIQDTGRRGYQQYGVPVSGAMDLFALCVGNALVRNARDDAALEIHSPIALETDAPCLLAVTGADARVRVNDRALPQWTSVFARAGSLIEIAPTRGGWVYLAIHGGIDVPRVMGSRSTYGRGGFGGLEGRALIMGDEVRVGEAREGDWVSAAGRGVSERVRAWLNREKIARVVLGPHDDCFAREAIDALTREEFVVSENADRMGYRLQTSPPSPPLLGEGRRGEVVSIGVPLGAIQVPPDGQPIILMADHQTTGGYPIIATVIGADVPLVAQCAAGERLWFAIVDVHRAQEKWREMGEVIGES